MFKSDDDEELAYGLVMPPWPMRASEKLGRRSSRAHQDERRKLQVERRCDSRRRLRVCAEQEEDRVVALAHGRGVESAASTSTVDSPCVMGQLSRSSTSLFLLSLRTGLGSFGEGIDWIVVLWLIRRLPPIWFLRVWDKPFVSGAGWPEYCTLGSLAVMGSTRLDS